MKEPTMLEILVRLKRLYLEEIDRGCTRGLCLVACSLNNEDEVRFDEYLTKSKRGQKWFYTPEGKKTLYKGAYAWLREDVVGRLIWFDRNIKKLE